jgi:hypothetical protein
MNGMLNGFYSFKTTSLDENQEVVIEGKLQPYFTREFIDFIKSEDFIFDQSYNCLLDCKVPDFKEGDEKAWVRYCGTNDGSWYHKIWIRQNRIEACSEIECSGFYTNNNYWEFNNFEELKEAYNESVNWLAEITN